MLYQTHPQALKIALLDHNKDTCHYWIEFDDHEAWVVSLTGHYGFVTVATADGSCVFTPPGDKPREVFKIEQPLELYSTLRTANSQVGLERFSNCLNLVCLEMAEIHTASSRLTPADVITELHVEAACDILQGFLTETPRPVSSIAFNLRVFSDIYATLVLALGNHAPTIRLVPFDEAGPIMVQLHGHPHVLGFLFALSVPGYTRREADHDDH